MTSSTNVVSVTFSSLYEYTRHALGCARFIPTIAVSS